jgi:hypothetical protein
VDGLTGSDRGSDKYLLDAVQLVQLALQRSDARCALRQGQRIVRHALDFGHHETEHPVWEQRGEQRQRVACVLGLSHPKHRA